MELSVNRGGEANGYFVGLGALELNAVPEPVAASLRLLGLAVLMMRRRRAYGFQSPKFLFQAVLKVKTEGRFFHASVLGSLSVCRGISAPKEGFQEIPG